MSLTAKCRCCRLVLLVPDSFMGKTFVCPACRSKLRLRGRKGRPREPAADAQEDEPASDTD